MDSSEKESFAASFTDSERAAVYKVMRQRRDIRRFLPEPVPDTVLRRILEMAHLAPSVGFMQPWNFIVISATDIRQQVKAVFDEVNQRELSRIEDPNRKELYSRLTLEGILEAPLNLAVTCDQR